jgi:uncharacterized protein YndB with AHSA1/START domain
VTEIRVDVDLTHPPERVWRVLTEAHLILGWMPVTNFLLTEDRHFSFGVHLEGLDEQVSGHVVSADKPYTLVMRWEAPNLHTLLSITLQAADGGCRLTLTQQGFLGAQGAMRRRVLQRTYVETLAGPFAQSLDRVAADDIASASRAQPVQTEKGKRNGGRAFSRTPRSNSAPGLTSYVRVAAGPKQTGTMPGFAAAVLSAQASQSDSSRPMGVVRVAEVAKLAEPSPRGRFKRAVRSAWIRGRALAVWAPERRSQAIAAGAALLLLLAMVALMVGHSTVGRSPHPPQVGGPAGDPYGALMPAPPQPLPSKALSSAGAPAPLRSSGAAAAPDAPTPPPSASMSVDASLRATFKTDKSRVSGYDASITIENSTTAPVAEWTVTVTLPLLDLRVRNVQGAVTTSNGKEITFTPVDATRTVDPGAQVQLKFQVDGVGKPTACVIDGQPCGGIPE